MQNLTSFYNDLLFRDTTPTQYIPEFTDFEMPEFNHSVQDPGIELPKIKPIDNIDFSSISLTDENLKQAQKPLEELTDDEKWKLAISSVNEEFYSNRKASDKVLGEATLTQMQRYTDPNIRFNPNTDMEEIYSRVHPASTYKAMQKAFATGSATAFYGIKNSLSDLKNIASGNYEKVWDNEGVKEMADYTLNAELDHPLYYSKDTPEYKKMFYDTVAASGSAIGSWVDGIASSVLLSVGGSAITGFTGSVPAAGLGMIKLAKSVGKGVITAKKAFTRMRETSDKIMKLNKLAEGRKTMKGLSTVGRTLLSTHMTVTSEAALQAELNKRNFINEMNTKFIKENGFVTEEQTKEIEQKANELQASTYKQNWALVGASTLFQIPGIMTGKMTSRLTKNKFFDVVNKNGKLVVEPKSLKKAFGKEVLLDSISEGGEEYFQSVIDDATTEYYKSKFNSSKEVAEQINYIDQFAKSTFDVAGKGALREAFIGAILGGGMSTIGTGINISRSNPSGVIEEFNENTQNVIEYLQRDDILNQKMKDSDSESILNEKVSNIAKISYKLGTYENRLDYFQKLKNLSVEEIESEFKIKGLDSKTKEKVIDEMIDTFSSTIEILDTVDTVYDINPINTESSWFKRAVNKIGKDQLGIERKLSNVLWRDFKNIYADSLIKNRNLEVDINNLEVDLSSNIFIPITNTLSAIPDSRLSKALFNNPKNLKKSVNEFIATLDLDLPTTLTDDLKIQSKSDLELKKKLSILESDNIYDKINTIFNHYNMSVDTRSKLEEYYKLRNIKKIFEDERDSFSNPRTILSKLEEFSSYYTHIVEAEKKARKESAKTDVTEKEDGSFVVDYSDGTSETFNTKEEADKAKELRELKDKDKDETTTILEKAKNLSNKEKEAVKKTEDKILPVKKEVINNTKNFTSTADAKEIEKSMSDLLDIDPTKSKVARAGKTSPSITQKVERLVSENKLTPVGKEYFFDIGGGRDAMLFNIKGVNVLFYRSSRGTSSKTKGQWYPVFYMNNNWLVKGISSNYETGYGSKTLQDVLNMLNTEFKYDKPQAQKVIKPEVLGEVLGIPMEVYKDDDGIYDFANYYIASEMLLMWNNAFKDIKLDNIDRVYTVIENLKKLNPSKVKEFDKAFEPVLNNLKKLLTSDPLAESKKILKKEKDNGDDGTNAASQAKDEMLTEQEIARNKQEDEIARRIAEEQKRMEEAGESSSLFAELKKQSEELTKENFKKENSQREDIIKYIEQNYSDKDRDFKNNVFKELNEAVKSGIINIKC